MSTTAIIAIAIGVVVVLGAIAFFTLARRSDVRGAGALSGETCSATVGAQERRTRRHADHRGRRRGGGRRSPFTQHRRCRSCETEAPVPWTPPDPEVIGVTRRQFFNRATVSLMSVGLAGFAAAASWPSCGRAGPAASAERSPSASSTIIKDGIKLGGGFFYAAEARSWITEYPAEALPLAQTVYTRTRCCRA
jgi:cytochrome b6-f complex iron-sulfur subunit